MTGGLRGIAASGEGALRAVRKFRAEDERIRIYTVDEAGACAHRSSVRVREV